MVFTATFIKRFIIYITASLIIIKPHLYGYKSKKITEIAIFLITTHQEQKIKFSSRMAILCSQHHKRIKL